MFAISRTIFFINILIFINQVSSNDYETKREQILREESLLAFGGDIKLNNNETIVNECLMHYKLQDLDYAFKNPENYNLSNHFFYYRDSIRQSKVYKILKDLPKGALLHVHDKGILSANYLMNLTYMDNLYVCFDINRKVNFMFSNKTPNSTCNGQWQLMSDARANAENIINFDENLRKNFTLLTNNPRLAYRNINKIWRLFSNYFTTIGGLLTYVPVWEQYIYDVLKTLHDDKIMYVELRSYLPELYELDGTWHDRLISTKLYRKAYKRFIKDYPDFFGAKLIFSPYRVETADELDMNLVVAKKIKKEIPDFFGGFDLIGQEDKGGLLLDYVPQLTAASKDLNYFFHAGETNWYGTTTDENLIDAILIGAKRLGHAYSLVKHPLLMEQVVNKDIGIEVNVISNNVLFLVQDVRNHPLASFFARGLPVVISSDDPGVWEAEPITDDFYVAFVGVASKKADLRLLKKLALNSIKYSALSDSEKVKAFAKFNTQWNNFVYNFQCSKY